MTVEKGVLTAARNIVNLGEYGYVCLYFERL